MVERAVAPLSTCPPWRGSWAWRATCSTGRPRGWSGSWTEGAAMELAASQVRANSVHPGYINTGMAEYRAAAGTDIEGVSQL
jgi:hypothetical protein